MNNKPKKQRVYQCSPRGLYKPGLGRGFSKQKFSYKQLYFWTFMNFRSYFHVFTGILQPKDVILGHINLLGAPSPGTPGGQGIVGRVLHPLKKAGGEPDIGSVTPPSLAILAKGSPQQVTHLLLLGDFTCPVIDTQVPGISVLCLIQVRDN
jgi:hypothetical protein